MKPAALVAQMLEGDGEPAREATPSLTVPETGMSRYPRDNQATENAIEMVGDGQEPDIFFVTIGDAFIQEQGRIDVDEVYAIGQFDVAGAAEEKFNDVVLDGAEGPRWVQIENRTRGLVKQKFLTKVVSYEEETRT